jgi:RNA polymerase sigma factor (sigma-70 family)
MNSHTATLTAPSDEKLRSQALQGDRDAFGRIVERYQSLVCSLAYASCGNLARSEDLAQETFLTAWQRLAELKDDSKLRAWLCGIVRNLAANSIRRDRRRSGDATSLDNVLEPAASEADPAVHAVTLEEEVMLWRSLESMPETYREPMVLFYRQGQSIAEVSATLELTEDAVKQRLSRGRAMLRDELAAVVESTLTRTRPTGAFTAAVMAVLPAASPGIAQAVSTTAAAGEAAGIAKGVFGVSQWAFIGPVIGLFIGLFSSRAAASIARSPEERECVLRLARRVVIFAWCMSIGLVGALLAAGKLYPASPVGIVVGILIWVVVLVGVIHWQCSRCDQEVKRIRAATGTDDEAFSQTLAARGLKLNRPWLYQSKARFFGLPIVSIATGETDPDSTESHRAVGWIAIGDTAISPLFAFGGCAVAPLAVGAITVGIFSLSLWGLAFGGLAVGGIAVGWWAFGMAAAGWQSAAGAAAIAKDYALGALAQAGEANTPAVKEWFLSQWFMSPLICFFAVGHALILLIVAVSIGRLMHRARMLRRLSH